MRTRWGRGGHWTIAAGAAGLAAVVVAALLALPSTGTPPAPLNTVAQTLACLEHVGEQPVTASADALYARGATDAPTPRAVYVLRDATILAVFAGTTQAEAVFGSPPGPGTLTPLLSFSTGEKLQAGNLVVEFSPDLGQDRYDADENHIRLCIPGLNHTDPPTPYRTTYVGSAAIDHGRALIPEPRRLPVFPGELNLGVVFHGGPPITGFGPSCTGERCPASKTVTVRSSRGRLVSRRTLEVGERLGLWLGDPGRYLVSAPGCATARLTVRLKRRTSADLVCRLPRQNTV